MKKIVVTGGSGKAGRATVHELLEHGYEVLNIDIAPPREPLSPYLAVDLMQLGETIEALHDADAVVHLAANPNPHGWTEERMFRHNTTTTYNIFRAATLLKLKRVVWASSETTLGLPFDVPPRYAPVDEDHYPFPTTTYALSKVASETIATHIAGWSGVPFIGLRFSNILGPADYEGFPSYWADPRARRWNLWGYFDERDAAAACRLALEAPAEGSTSYIIAAADTVMNRSSAGLLEEVFPGVPLTRDVGEFESLLATGRAKEALGFVPRHSWRDHIAAP